MKFEIAFENGTIWTTESDTKTAIDFFRELADAVSIVIGGQIQIDRKQIILNPED